MTKELKTTLFEVTCRFLRRKLSLLLVAFMLGISNVILQEDRMVHDTRARIEQREMQPDDDWL